MVHPRELNNYAEIKALITFPSAVYSTAPWTRTASERAQYTPAPREAQACQVRTKWLAAQDNKHPEEGGLEFCCLPDHLISASLSGDSPCHAVFSSLFDPATLHHWLPTKEHAGGCSGGWSCLLQLCSSAQPGRHTCWNPFWQLQEEQHSQPCLWQAREYACWNRQEETADPEDLGVTKGAEVSEDTLKMTNSTATIIQHFQAQT